MAEPEEWHIEKVLDQKVRKNNTKVLVKWTGWKDPTWEPKKEICKTKQYWDWSKNHDWLLEKVFGEKTENGEKFLYLKWKDEHKPNWEAFNESIDNTEAYGLYFRNKKEEKDNPDQNVMEREKEVQI